ncbi:MAG: type II secretion system protein GspL [Pseudomonas sp.]|nr:type II secretion system protein GspL [Pseudomonas sp.]MDZ4190968.1 type II secretion system protein GspL [Pseudomonas sp.]
MTTPLQGALVRVALPPLSTLRSSSPVRCAWLSRQGQLLEHGHRELGELGASVQGKSLEICLHPEDSLLACIELPPLAPGRLAEAVRLAAETMLLGGDQSVHLVHGPRGMDGQVQLVWLARDTLQDLLQRLHEYGLQPRGLYAAPYFMSVAEPGTSTAALWDGHLLVRQDAQRGWVHALPEEGGMQLREQPVQWIGEEPPPFTAVALVPAEQAWTGPAPACNLLQGLHQHAHGKPRWWRAAGSCAMAVLVWTLGLNMYAIHMADEGQALKAQMVSRVQQVFPELPIILNPLQQARQQRDARLSGGTAGGEVTFTVLVQQASHHMPFMTGAVERLDFEGDELRLTPRAPARKPPTNSAWQTALAQAGLHAELAAGQWSVRPVTGGAEAPDE